MELTSIDRLASQQAPAISGLCLPSAESTNIHWHTDFLTWLELRSSLFHSKLFTDGATSQFL